MIDLNFRFMTMIVQNIIKISDLVDTDSPFLIIILSRLMMMTNEMLRNQYILF